MGNFTIAATVIVIINVFMLLFQASIENVSGNDFNFYDCTGTIFEVFDSDCEKYGALNTSAITDYYPQADQPIVPTGSDSTDFFKMVKEWFSAGFGIKWLLNVAFTPGRLIMSMGLPDVFGYALASMWYLLTFLAFISYSFGRD